MMQAVFVAILTFTLGTAGAAPKYLCTYYDIVDYLNISSHDKLHTYILPKINLKPVEVKVDFFLVAILSVVEKLQTVSFYFVLNLEWQNPFATWDPRDFCNISEIVLPMDTYWSPPIFILERVNGQNPELNYMVLMHNGSFNSTRPYQVTLTCSLVIFKFPFDTQMCNLSIASFLYPAVTDFVMKTRRTPAEIMKDSKSLILTDGEWQFTNLSIIEFTEMMDHKGFSVVTYVISMERRPTLYILNLILPTCALYLLDMAVLFGPSSLEEKINFQIAIILGSSMLAVILNNSLPTSSNKPPIIVVFFLGTFLLMIMAVLDTLFLLYQQRKSRRPGKVLRSFQQDPQELPKRPPGKLAKEGPQLLHPPRKAPGQGQPAKHLWQLRELEPFLPVLEKVLLFSHLFLSLFFFTVISVKWSS
ncbi:5-hydroxytryptamine receptor 3A-like isoform X3 [Passer domesticus]